MPSNCPRNEAAKGKFAAPHGDAGDIIMHIPPQIGNASNLIEGAVLNGKWGEAVHGRTQIGLDHPQRG